FFCAAGVVHALHSFPTRRSSDLCWRSACCSRSMSRRAARKRRRVACRGEGDLLAVAPRGAGTASLRPVPRRRLAAGRAANATERSEEHTSELQSLRHLVCRLLLE